MKNSNRLSPYIQELNRLFKKEKEIIVNAFDGDLLKVAHSSYEEIYELFKEIEKEVEKLEWRI